MCRVLGANDLRPAIKGSEAKKEGTGPLGKISCDGVWNNIDVIFSAVERGIAESTYVIRPGGDPSAIRLRYNVPVLIDEDGEPGEYTVYVDNVAAGSFMVELISLSDLILIFVITMLTLAFIVGMVILRRRQQQY